MKWFIATWLRPMDGMLGPTVRAEEQETRSPFVSDSKRDAAITEIREDELADGNTDHILLITPVDVETDGEATIEIGESLA